MKFTRNIGFLLLAVYLILIGVSVLLPAFVLPHLALGILALVAGIFILIGK